MSNIGRIFKNILPYGIVRKIEENRSEKNMSSISINDAHVANAKLVANRESILNMLPKNSTVAELGVDRGDFSEEILRICKPRKLVLVDVWNSKRYDQNKFDMVRKRFAKQLVAEQVSITRKLSTEAAGTFEDGYFDWIYIDTDHSYNTTIKELNQYKDKVKDNGFIAGHDYVMGNWSKGYKYGVIEAVAEFCVTENWKFVCISADFNENPSFVITRIN